MNLFLFYHKLLKKKKNWQEFKQQIWEKTQLIMFKKLMTNFSTTLHISTKMSIHECLKPKA